MMQGYIAVPKYFDAKQKMAMAIPSSGESLGAVVFPLIISQLNQDYGWRGMFLILSGIALHICVCGALLRPLKIANTKSEKQSIQHDWSFLKMWNFHILYLSAILVGFGTSIVYGHLGAYANFELDISLTKTAILYSTIGVSLILFKLLFGLLTNMEHKCFMFDPFKLYILFCTIGGIASLTLLWIGDFTGLMAFSVAFGACYACIGGALTPSILIRLYGNKGLEQLSLTYGVMQACWGVGYVLGSPSAGKQQYLRTSLWLFCFKENSF